MTKLDELFALAAEGNEKEGDETVVEMVDLANGNGKDAYLPYFFYETVFFPLKPLTEYIRETAAGTIKITASNPVSLVPHAQVFLATIALAQMSKKILRRTDALGRERFEAIIPVRDFYELLGWGSKRKRDLTNALADLAALRVETNFADGRRAAYSIFGFEDVPARGRRGGEIFFDFSPIISQTEPTLFANACIAARLKSPTAVALFWLFSYRSAVAFTIPEWHRVLGATEEDVARWGRRTFQTALGELLALGFTVEEREFGKILIRRPPAKKRKSSFKRG